MKIIPLALLACMLPAFNAPADLAETTRISNFSGGATQPTAVPGDYAVLIKDPMSIGTTRTTGFLRGSLLASYDFPMDHSSGFSGVLYWQGFKYLVGGGLHGTNDSLTQTFPAKNLPHRKLTVFLTRHGVLGGLDGTLTDGDLVTPFSSYPPAVSYPNPSSRPIRSGKITGLIFAESGNIPNGADANQQTNSVKLGTGWLAGTVTGLGDVRYVGRMPDGRRFSGSSAVNANGSFAVYNVFPKSAGSGSFFGAIGLGEKGVAFNSLQFERPPSKTPYYAAGFSTSLTSACSYYVAPLGRLPIVNFGGGSPNVNLNIFNGGLAHHTTPVTYSGADRFAFRNNPLQYQFTTNRTNGLFTASFLHPTLGLKTISGAFVQGGANDVGSNIGNGFAGGVFKGSTFAGGLNFTPINNAPVAP